MYTGIQFRHEKSAKAPLALSKLISSEKGYS